MTEKPCTPQPYPFTAHVEVKGGVGVWRPQFVGRMQSMQPKPQRVLMGLLIQDEKHPAAVFAPGDAITVEGPDGTYTIRGNRL